MLDWYSEGRLWTENCSLWSHCKQSSYLAEHWWRAVAVWSSTVGMGLTASLSFTMATHLRPRCSSEMSSKPSKTSPSRYVRYLTCGTWCIRLLNLMILCHLHYYCSHSYIYVLSITFTQWLFVFPDLRVPSDPVLREPLLRGSTEAHGPSLDLYLRQCLGHKASGQYHAY